MANRNMIGMTACCCSVLLFLATYSRAQESNNSIVGWGSQVFGVDLSGSFRAVAGGYSHSLGVKSDGSIVAWGDNEYGQCSIPGPNVHFTMVAAGWGHSLGLKDDGSIEAWGYNEFQQCDVPLPNAEFIAIAAGRHHSLGLKSDGTIVAWGWNEHGQCSIPSPNEGFTAIAAGWFHSLGLKSDSSIVAWGSNTDENGYNTGQSVVPAQNSGYIDVAGGGYHSLGLKADGVVVAWGRNNHNQCDVPAPNTGFIKISGGGYHCLGYKIGGTVVAWGGNNEGECNVPEPNSDFVAVACGRIHSLGFKSDGSISVWGNNEYSQCNGPAPNNGFAAVAVGLGHNLGLKIDGTVAAWGRNSGPSGEYAGQCDVPPPNGNFKEVAAGGYHSLGLRFNGSVVAWGLNDHGQCNVPLPNTEFVSVAAGTRHSLGLKKDGTIVAWGDNGSGQLDIPDPYHAYFTAIAADGNYSLGLKHDGSVVGWGDNSFGQCTVALPNADYSAITAGGGVNEYHSMGLKNDGSIAAWGSNSCGQCDVPQPNTEFDHLAAGDGFSFGLLADGVIVAWGSSSYGQDIVPYPNRGYSAVEAGMGYGIAIRAASADMPPHVTIGAANGNANQAIVVEAELHDDVEITGGRVYYRAGGSDMGFHSSRMARASGDTWLATIPGSATTERGIQYYVMAYDESDSTRAPMAPFFESISISVVAMPAFQLDGSDNIGGYAMLGLPLTPLNSSPEYVFNELGGYDSSRWRYLTWQPEDEIYSEFPAAQGVVPGQGFWILSRLSQEIAVSGTTVRLDNPYEIQLQEGWNQIANPFAFDVPFSDITVPNGSGGVLYAYTSNPEDRYEELLLSEEHDLAPYRGYWIWQGGAPGVLQVSPGGGGISKGRPAIPASNDALQAQYGWNCSVRILAGTVGDAGCRFGMCQNSGEGIDPTDILAAPQPPGGYASLAFLSKSGSRLLRDFRGLDVPGARWDLLCESDQAGAEYRMVFTTERPLPAGWKLWAFDVGTLREVELTAGGEIVGNVSGTPFEEHWCLAAGPQEFIAMARQEVEAELESSIASFTLWPVRPNPLRADGQVEISLMAPRRADVKLDVYDVAGRKVSSLYSGQVEPGLQRFAWDGRDTCGRLVASGTYLMRLHLPTMSEVRKFVVVR